MRLGARTLLAAAVPLAAAAAWLALWPVVPSFEQRPSPVAVAARAQAGAPASDSLVGLAEPLVPLSAAPAEKETAPPSPGARVEQLTASGDPHDAYRAFRLIDRCARAIEARREFEPVCQDMAAVQLRLRLSLLETAARAGVPGATTAWTGEGPFGDKTALTQRPDDPLVVEWVRQAVQMIRAAARRDDVAAITQFGWLAVHWDMSDGERLSAMLNHPAEWVPQGQESAAAPPLTASE